jgi:xylulokinase
MGLYLGFDSSTQSLKAMIVDAERGGIVVTETVNFGKDLPQYGCPEGFLPNPNPLIRHSPPQMWLDALDLCLQRLKDRGAPLGRVKGISGSGQQHGSVYLKQGVFARLRNLDPKKSLAQQLAVHFSRPSAPIWMDSSTQAACNELMARVGHRLQADTGSPAIERFTGPQIRHFSKLDPEAYFNTARIHLVSSFMASVLCGGDAPIDYGDGAGMNLLNLHSLKWDEEICEATAPSLANRLPPVSPSRAVAGGLHAYFEKYGLTPGTPVIAWSGDNPCSLIGVGAWRPGTAVVSLGTSFVFFAAMESMHTDPAGCGHVFGNPAGGFMSLICFKNGALARVAVRDAHQLDWAGFEAAMARTPPGNNGNRMLPYFISEITPVVLKEGVRYQGSPKFVSGKAPAEFYVRALVEAQVLSLRLHSGWIGSFDTVRVTGGASADPWVAKTVADVFQAKVERIAVADSAALGAALRAAQAVGGVAWDDLSAKFAAATVAVQPDPALRAVYDDALKAYADFEKSAPAP